MKKTFWPLLALVLTCACIKPPDNGKSLGDQTTGAYVNQAVSDAQVGVPETQSFHVGDNGVVVGMETVFSSTRLKETDVYNITGFDQKNIYYEDFKVRENTTTKYYAVRPSVAASTSTPTPAIVPDPVPAPTATPAQISKKTTSSGVIAGWFKNIKNKISLALSKVSVGFSTAMGETPVLQQDWNMTFEDKRILSDLKAVMQSYGVNDDGNNVQVNKSKAVSYEYYGLKKFSHSYLTNNCSQVKNCKVNATHVEFNQVDPSSGNRVHWVFEISKEVPGLFMVMSRCGSSIAIIRNAQVPFMECDILDTFHFGTGASPP